MSKKYESHAPYIKMADMVLIGQEYWYYRGLQIPAYVLSVPYGDDFHVVNQYDDTVNEIYDRLTNEQYCQEYGIQLRNGIYFYIDQRDKEERIANFARAQEEKLIVERKNTAKFSCRKTKLNIHSLFRCFWFDL